MKLIQIFMCPQDVQCDVMCKGFILLEFIVYSFLARYNSITVEGTVVNGFLKVKVLSLPETMKEKSMF